MDITTFKIMIIKEENPSLFDVEGILDNHKRLQKFININDRSELGKFILSYIPSRTEYQDFIRVCKKIMWFSVFPADHGRWETL